MNRWWADADQARVILDRVDDSDVVQGVGTAVLGYHALAAGVLKPLSEQTLVDVQEIRTSLMCLDLEPVAKALAEATRPVMGEASDKYGELLAANLHEQAVDATSRFVQVLTNTGVDWPSAVSRAADIHGVPLDRLGPAGEKLRGPRLAPLAQQDYADRVLVGYASHVGHREADGTVSKAMRMRNREFDEDEVHRDRLGRFAVQAESTVAPTATRRDFAAYREARKKRAAKKASRPRLGLTVEQEVETTPAPASRAKEATQTDTREALKNQLREELKGKVKADLKESVKQASLAQARKLLEALDAKPPTQTGGSLMQPLPNEPRRGDGLYVGNRMRVQNERYFLLPDWVANEVMHSGGFNVGKLTATRPIPVPTAMNARELQGALDDMSDTARILKRPESSPGRMVIVRLVGGEVAFAPDSDNHTEGVWAELAGGGTYEVLPDQAMDYDDLDFELDLTDFTYKPNPASKMPMRRSMTVKLANGSEFDYNDMDPKRDEWDDDFDDTPPLPHDFRKSDWDESEVNRDPRGRFAREGMGKLIPAQSDKAARIRAYQEAKRRRAKRQARSASDRLGLRVVEDSPSLGSMAREQAAPAARTEAVSARDRLRADLREKLKKEIRAQLLAQAADRRQEARLGGRKGLDLSGDRAVFPDDEQLATMLHIAESGGYDGETQAFQALIGRLSRETKPGRDAVDLMDKDRPDGREMVATPTYESRVPAFDSPEEAEAYAREFVSDMYDAWDGPQDAPMTKRLAEFMSEADRSGSYVYAKAVPHASLEGKWVPKAYYEARPEQTVPVLVGSPRDFARASKGEVPRLVVDDPVPLGVLMASNGFDSGRIEATHDAMVQVIRMDFMDNVRH